MNGDYLALGSESTVTVGTTSGLILTSNSRRLGVLITAPAANPVTISSHNPAVAGQGITLRSGTKPVYLSVDELGSWLLGALYAITVTAPETIGVVELMQP